MKIKRRQVGEVMVLMLSGKIMAGEDYELFTTEIKTLINEGHIDVLLNMEHVEWVNSGGIGTLISGYSSLKKNGGRMKFCKLLPRVHGIFIATQIQTLFETFDAEPEAVASFATASPQ